MKKPVFLLLLLCAIFSQSCDLTIDTPQTPTLVTINAGAYILNNGNYNSNDASIDYYNFSTGAYFSDLYQNQNGVKLGDVAQDIIRFNDLLLISVYNSQVIQITDLVCKKLAEVKVENRSPRYFAKDTNFVYVSYYEGYVAKIDPYTQQVLAEVKVGNNPDQLVCVDNNKLFVANSGGMNYPNYDNTISVIDLNTFTVTDNIEVVINPTSLVKDSKGNVYCASMGNYQDIPNTLQKIDSKTHAVTVIDDVVPTSMSMGKDDIMYIMSQVYDKDWNTETKFYKYDCRTDKIDEEYTPPVNIRYPYGIFADPLEEIIAIPESDFVNKGNVHFMNSKSQFVSKVTSSKNPIKVLYYYDTIEVYE